MTRKKKGAILISALALIAVIVIGGTLAYFTDTDDAQNVFTLGNVQGDLTETTTPGTDETTGHPIKDGTPTDDGIEYDHIVPGDWLSKEPRVNLTGTSEDAYVRVKLEVINEDGKLNADQKLQLLSDECLNYGTDWVVGTDGYVYYQTKLTRDADGTSQTTPVFTLVKIPETWGNKTADVNFSIKITADLIQSDNFTPGHNAAGQIDSWGNVTIEDYNN